MWREAHDAIATVHGGDGPGWADLFRYAPGLSDRVGWAEQDAESVSLGWVAGGRGDVQGAIAEWCALWIEAINLVRDSWWD
jgi:hypothetical protein